jgi:hypothetical protein
MRDLAVIDARSRARTRRPEPIPHAHELVGWEAGVGIQLACLIAFSLCSLPLLASEIGLALPRWPLLDAWLGTRNARITTGLLASGIVLFQLSLSARRRLVLGRSIAVHSWRTAHQLAPFGLVVLVLLHTRGRSGVNLNRWLVSVFLIQALLVLGGHVMKAFVARYGSRGALAKLNHSANTAEGLIHRAGVRLHVLFAVSFVVLLLVHVLSVYYF